jgi:hypothetical protein
MSLDTSTLDSTPQGLADLVDGLAQGLIAHDRESASSLITAREGLRSLAWARFARATTRRSLGRTMQRRHQTRRWRDA